MLLKTGLITIFILALVVPSVLGAEFGVALDMSEDVSHADGLQLSDAAAVALTVRFEQAVVLTGADVSVSQYDENGGFLGSAVPVISPTTATKEFRITITRAVGATRLVVRTKAGLASADAFNNDTSAEGNWTVDLLGVDPQPNAGPDVYKIALVGEPFETITTASFQIRVLLSEEPKDGFNKELLEVTNATVSSVVKLTSPGASTTVNGATVSATGRDNRLYLYLVTLETQFGEKRVEIKVRNFAGMETPTGALFQQTYVRPSDASLTEGKDKLTLKTSRAATRTVVITVSIPDNTSAPVDTDAIEQEADATVTDVPETTPDDDTATNTEVIDTSVMIPTEGRIYISEIMFARGVHGTLPQWIEISNGSQTEQVNLSGWTLTVENTTADTDVSVGAKAVFTIPEGTRIDPSGQHETPSTVLVVTEQGRNNLDGNRMAESQVVNLWVDRQVELIPLGILNRRYSMLSDMAFSITLAPPATAEAIDVVGNLADDGTAAWALPVSEEGGRSSIIRRHVSAEPKDGEMLGAWVLASETGLVGSVDTGVRSYYGLPTDVGTPGFRPGGALPVELSHFRPARKKDTGAVVITWSTQSELNNAGFFIKRSQQKDGEFKVINSAMVPGAGTTSEKQFYTYTDTTAQPNVAYYYQIEDVSLDGNRQTLTRGVRLKGHVGAVGKAVVMWGELKR